VGNYATSAEVKARFDNDAELAALTDNEENGVADEAVITEVLDDAEGEVDSYVGVRYKIPYDTTKSAVVKARLKSVTLDLAVWRLLIRGDVISDPKQQSRDMAIEYLKALAVGDVVLPQTDTPETTDSREPLVAYGTAGTSSSSARLFSRSTQSRM